MTVTREVERTVREVPAELRPRNAVEGTVLARADVAGIVLDRTAVGFEEGAGASVEPREVPSVAHADHPGGIWLT